MLVWFSIVVAASVVVVIVVRNLVSNLCSSSQCGLSVDSVTFVVVVAVDTRAIKKGLVGTPTISQGRVEHVKLKASY